MTPEEDEDLKAFEEINKDIDAIDRTIVLLGRFREYLVSDAAYIMGG